MTRERRHLVLVGLMGSGKSAVGKACAERLGRPFVDTDAMVEARTGRSVAEIFRDDGEDAFRSLEAEAVRDAATSAEPSVLACGGGAVVAAENRRVLREHGRVVLLTAPPDVLADRVASDVGRPLLAAAPAIEVLERLAAERDTAYRAAADVVIDTAGREVDDVVAAVLRSVGDDAGTAGAGSGTDDGGRR